MRLFPNAETSRAWDRSVVDEAGELLCVSQVRREARPSDDRMRPSDNRMRPRRGLTRAPLAVYAILQAEGCASRRPRHTLRVAAAARAESLMPRR